MDSRIELNATTFFNRGLELDNAKKYPEAFKAFKLAANKGHVEAQYQLALYHLLGLGIPVDLPLAISLLKEVAEKEFPPAQCRLGRCYLEGIGVEKNTEEAVRLFKKAAKEKHYLSYFLLANCYKNGEGVTKNLSKAVVYYKLVAEYEERAKIELACCYFNGDGIGKDVSQATKLALIIKKPNAEICFILGMHYLAKKEIQIAYNHFAQAAQQKHGKAQYQLGSILWQMKQWNSAAQCYYDAASNGDSQGQLKFGNLCLENLVKTPENSIYKTGIEYVKAAAEQGLAEAQYTFGFCYFAGKHVERDLELAFKYFDKAASQKDGNALAILAFSYLEGKYFQKNLTKAVQLYQQAVSVNNSCYAQELAV